MLRAIERRHLFVRGGSSAPPAGLVVARFHHGLSRSADPQLHTHLLLPSRLPLADGGTARLDPWPLLRLQKVLGQTYRHALAARTRSLGWTLRPHGLAFECERYPRELLAGWSRRARAVEAALAREGLERRTASARRKTVITLRTRTGKPGGSREDHRRRWLEEARALDPGWDLRPPSTTFVPAPLRGRDLLADAREGGRRVGAVSVKLASRGLRFREVEIFHALYRDALGRGSEEALERVWRLAVRAGLFVSAPPPAGRVPGRTGRDLWYRPRGAELWIERLRRVWGAETAPRTPVAPLPGREIDVDATGYAGFLRVLVTVRDLGRRQALAERGNRIAARTALPGTDLVREAGLGRAIALVPVREGGRERRAERDHGPAGERTREATGGGGERVQERARGPEWLPG